LLFYDDGLATPVQPPIWRTISCLPVQHIAHRENGAATQKIKCL
jgi:hypothetical protein